MTRQSATVPWAHCTTMRPSSPQLAPERLEPREPRLDGGELRPRDGVGLRAGLIGPVLEAQEVTDGTEREAQLAGVADEGQPLPRGLTVEALVADRALGRSGGGRRSTCS